MSRKVKLFIATSLDGYIAGPHGEIDWLFTDQDYGYTEFISGIDTIIMGRKSYEATLNFDEWPYKGMVTYVFTRRTDHPADPKVTFTSEPIADFINNIRKIPGKDIWLMGGGELIGSFLNAGLVDEATIGIHPIILGDGIPLIPKGTKQTRLHLTDEKRYETGLLLASYMVIV